MIHSGAEVSEFMQRRLERDSERINDEVADLNSRDYELECAARDINDKVEEYNSTVHEHRDHLARYSALLTNFKSRLEKAGELRAAWTREHFLQQRRVAADDWVTERLVGGLNSAISDFQLRRADCNLTLAENRNRVEELTRLAEHPHFNHRAAAVELADRHSQLLMLAGKLNPCLTRAQQLFADLVFWLAANDLLLQTADDHFDAANDFQHRGTTYQDLGLAGATFFDICAFCRHRAGICGAIRESAGNDPRRV